MALVDLGYYLSPQVDGGDVYYGALSALGWAQALVLACWGAHDAAQIIGHLWRLDRHPVVVGRGVGR